jgi:hypothetical protein
LADFLQKFASEADGRIRPHNQFLFAGSKMSVSPQRVMPDDAWLPQMAGADLITVGRFECLYVF